tara:strand:- start:145 stop:471 length:327 start_codon:yes stop_codon:yes gene_type:complete
MNNKTVKELKNYCRDNNIKGYSKITKKQEILNFINTSISKKVIKNSLIVKELKNIQDKEYDDALKADLERQTKEEFEKNKKKKDIKYSQNLSNNELQIMRMARLTRFN